MTLRTRPVTTLLSWNSCSSAAASRHRSIAMAASNSCCSSPSGEVVLAEQIAIHHAIGLLVGWRQHGGNGPAGEKQSVPTRGQTAGDAAYVIICTEGPLVVG